MNDLVRECPLILSVVDSTFAKKRNIVLADGREKVRKGVHVVSENPEKIALNRDLFDEEWKKSL